MHLETATALLIQTSWCSHRCGACRGWRWMCCRSLFFCNLFPDNWFFWNVRFCTLDVRYRVRSSDRFVKKWFRTIFCDNALTDRRNVFIHPSGKGGGPVFKTFHTPKIHGQLVEQLVLLTHNI